MEASYNVLLLQFGVILFVSLVFGALAEFLSLPSILGYFTAGFLLGEQGLGFVPHSDLVRIFAELGILLLMFYIGLEFNVEKLRSSGFYAFLLSPLKSGTGFLLGYFLGRFLGFSPMECLVIGAALAVSSTAIISQIILEKRWHGRLDAQISIAMLILEDIFGVLFLAFLLGQAEHFTFNKFLLHATMIFFLITFLGTRVFNRLFSFIERVESRDLPLYALGLVVILSYGLSYFGLSPLLGAFFAGMILSQTAHARRIESELETFRKIFVLVFFTSLGLGYEITFTPRALALIVGALGIQVLQGVVMVVFGPFFGVPVRTAIRTSMLMLPIGEFSLFFAATAQAVGLPGAGEILAAMVGLIFITTLLTGFFFRREEDIENSAMYALPPSLLRLWYRVSPFFEAARRVTAGSGSEGLSALIHEKALDIFKYLLAVFFINYLAGYAATELHAGSWTYAAGYVLSVIPLVAIVKSFAEMFEGYTVSILRAVGVPERDVPHLGRRGAYVGVGVTMFVFSVLLFFVSDVTGVLTFQLVSVFFMLSAFLVLIYAGYSLLTSFLASRKPRV